MCLHICIGRTENYLETSTETIFLILMFRIHSWAIKRGVVETTGKHVSGVKMRLAHWCPVGTSTLQIIAALKIIQIHISTIGPAMKQEEALSMEMLNLWNIPNE